MLTVVAEPAVTKAVPASSASPIDEIVRDGTRRMHASAGAVAVRAPPVRTAAVLPLLGRALVLAWRLGHTFVHYTPRLADVPLGPRLTRQIGKPIRPLLFRKL